MNYKIIDIDDMNIEYTFLASEIENVDILDMINLHLRGGYNSIYTLPMQGLTKGKKITIRNKDFGFSATGRYTGVKMVLSNNPNVERAEYWFLFENQWASFLFDGLGWLLVSPNPLPIASPNFISKQDVKHGYIDIMEYLNPDKKIWFNNIDMRDVDVQMIQGRFFREGEIGVFQEDSFKAHTHKEVGKKHSHDIPHSNIIFPLQNILKVIKTSPLYPKKVRKYAEHIMKTTNTQPMKVLDRINQIRNEIVKLPKEVKQKLFLYKENLLNHIHYKDFRETLKKSATLEDKILDAIIDYINDNWETGKDFIILFIQNDWDEFVLLLQKFMPDSFITKLVESLGERAKPLIIGYINKHSLEIKDMVLATLKASPEFLALVNQIAAFLKTHVVLVDSTLTECEKTDPNNVPVAMVISNTDIANSVKGMGNQSMDIVAMGSALSDLFTVDHTTESSVIVSENQEGILETRPDNISGQYIIKCY